MQKYQKVRFALAASFVFLILLVPALAVEFDYDKNGKIKTYKVPDLNITLLNNTEACITDCYTDYMIKTGNKAAYIDDVLFRNQYDDSLELTKTGLNDYQVLVGEKELKIEFYNVNIPYDCSYEDTRMNNDTQQLETVTIDKTCYNQEQRNTTDYVTQFRTATEDDLSVDSHTTRIFRISGTKDPQFKIDNVLELKNPKWRFIPFFTNTYVIEEFAWWNASWDYSYPLNGANTSRPYEIVNMSIVGTKCENNTNTTRILFGDNTTIVPYIWHNGTLKNHIAFVANNTAGSYFLYCDDDLNVAPGNSTDAITFWMDGDGSDGHPGLFSTAQGTFSKSSAQSWNGANSIRQEATGSNGHMVYQFDQHACTTGEMSVSAIFYPDHASGGSFWQLGFGETSALVDYEIMHYPISPGKWSWYDGATKPTNVSALDHIWSSLSLQANCSTSEARLVFNNTFMNKKINDRGTINSLDEVGFYSANVNDDFYVDDLFICKGYCERYVYPTVLTLGGANEPEPPLGPGLSFNFTWNETIYETEDAVFNVSLIVNRTRGNFSSIYFYWNSTNLTSQISIVYNDTTDLQQNLTYEVHQTMPLIGINQTNVSFNWVIITLDSAGVGNVSNSSIQENQILIGYILQNFTTPTIVDGATFSIQPLTLFNRTPANISFNASYQGSTYTDLTALQHTFESLSVNATENITLFMDVQFGSNSKLSNLTLNHTVIPSTPINYTTSYNDSLYETQTGVYLLNVSWNNTFYDHLHAHFYWDGTNKSSDVTLIANSTTNGLLNYTFKAEFDAPLVDSDGEVKDFNWVYIVQGATANGSVNTTVENQSIHYGYNITNFQTPTVSDGTYFSIQPITVANYTADVNLSFNVSYQNNTYTDLSNIFTAVLNVTGNRTFEIALVMEVQNGADVKVRNLTLNHTVLVFGIAQCNSTNSYPAFNITFYNEQVVLDRITGDLEIDFVFIPGPGLNKTLGANYTGINNVTICLTPETSNFDTYAFMKMTTSAYTHRWFLVNSTASNASQNFVNIYNFNSSTGVNTLEVTIIDENYFEKKDVIVELQRYYTAEQLFRTVQMDKTGEDGKAFFHIIEESQDYRMLIRDPESNELLKTTDTLKFLCDATTNICDVSILVIPASAAATASQVITNVTFNNNTKMIRMDWLDPTGTTTDIRWMVTHQTQAASTVVCEDNVSLQSGTLYCNVSGTGGGSYTVRVYRAASPEVPIFEGWFTDTISGMFQVIDTSDSLLISAGIIMTVVLVGAWSPAVAIMLLILSVVILSVLGLTPLWTTSTIIAISALGIIANSIFLNRT
jgi:hypothetical protein